MIFCTLWIQLEINHADDNYVSVQHEELGVVEKVLKPETRHLVKWFSDNAMEANPNEC